MDTRVVILVLVTIAYLVLRGSPDQQSAKPKLVWFAVILLALESGLRYHTVGSDTGGYWMKFNSVMDTDLSELLASFAYNSEDTRDPGFPILMKVFSMIIPSWQLFLLSLAFFYYLSLGRLWNRYIDSLSGVMFAVVLTLSLFHVVALSGIRQQITTALTFALIPSIEQRNWKVVIPLILIGSTVHISALFFLLMIPLSYLRDKQLKFLLLASIFLVPVMYFSARDVVGYMAGFLNNDYYVSYIDSQEIVRPINYVLMCSLMSIFMFVFFRDLEEAPNFMKSAAILMTLTMPLIAINGSMIRIGQYFTIYLTMSFPFILDRKRMGWIYLAAFVVLVWFMAPGSFEYRFFWQ